MLTAAFLTFMPNLIWGGDLYKINIGSPHDVERLTTLQSDPIELQDKRLNPVPLPDEALEQWTQFAVENRAG